METGMTDKKITVEHLRAQFEDFESATNEARVQSEKCRDYRDLKQWTADQIDELERRKQAPIVVPKIPAKVDFLIGLERQGRSDPRAYPRTPEHEKTADAVTDALRFVADNTEFDEVASEVFEQGCIVEGYAGAVIEVEERRGQFEVVVNFLPFDRVYFDPYSRKRDFSDAQYMGIVVWMDTAEAKQRYPGKADQISELQTQVGGSETYDDKPQWVDGKRKRIKICQHYFRQNGVWHVAHFTDQLFLQEPAPSPLLDEYGEPECPMELVYGYMDREGGRYSLVASMLGLQDEINHRRSKALHQLSTRQVFYEQGTLPNPRKTANDLKKADGAVEFPPGSLSEGRVQVQSNTDLAAGQAQLLQEAKQELDARGASNILEGIAGDGVAMSGRALRTIQNHAQLEIGPLMDAHRKWKLRCYRQMWSRVKQFWDEERWVRVTDDEENLKWVGFNHPVTLGEKLHESATEGDQEAQAILQQMMAVQDPRLHEIVEVQNDVAEIDVDIIIDEAPDSVTIQQEQFETIAELARVYGPEHVPFEVILKLSSLRNKDQVMDQIAGDPQVAQMQAQMAEMQQQMQMMMAQLELEEKAADIEKVAADIRKKDAETEKLGVEVASARAFPDTKPQIFI